MSSGAIKFVMSMDSFKCSVQEKTADKRAIDKETDVRPQKRRAGGLSMLVRHFEEAIDDGDVERATLLQADIIQTMTNALKQ